MKSTPNRAVAIVGLGAILPDAPGVPEFWQNLCQKRYSISEVPADRWRAADYYDPDPLAPDKTYSKIGGWVRDFAFDWKGFRVPPRVAAAMDLSQQWAVSTAAQALADYGYPTRPLDLDRTAAVLGTAMGGEMHYLTSLRICFPEFARALESVGEFGQLPAPVRSAILEQWRQRVGEALPPVTEDSMPGELANVVSGRVANLLNLHGPNFITDAACASSFAAIYAGIELLANGHCDAVLAGGVDHNMGAATFVKFCKIGALSATGTRPFGDGADGFVMGEGAALFLLKRLEDAEAAGDRVYAVIRGVGGSSDGRAKGITAPNPAGQRLAVARAWESAGLDPQTASLVEAHGTSTRVGDVAEVESLSAVFGAAPRGSIALGSVKSNIGHLKAGAGAAGLLKATLSLYHGMLPPTLNARRPNPNIDFAATPFYLNHELAEWPRPANAPRRAGVSAYGFGGTNFHLVLEEHIPGSLAPSRSHAAGRQVEPAIAGASRAAAGTVGEKIPGAPGQTAAATRTGPAPLRGILALGAESVAGLQVRLDAAVRQVEAGGLPPAALPDPGTLQAAERLVVDFGTPAELAERLLKAQRALAANAPGAWKALAAQGVFRGSGRRAGKIAFLFPGQGSQYLNMGRSLAARSPIVAAVFAEADRVMAPLLGRPLSAFIFVDDGDPAARQQAEQGLMQTAITQPAVLAMDTAVYRLLAEYGFSADFVAGHSLGEYAALIAAGVLPLAEAVEASAARGREMTRLSVDDNGWMAAVMAPLAVIEQTLAEVPGYVVAANINSPSQCVIGGASQAVESAIALFNQRGYEARRIPVSHAFHTQIVAPASKPLRSVLDRLPVAAPLLPIVANVTGEMYPTDVTEIRSLLERQVASPVQWVKGLETLYAAGVRTFVEVGPKKALKGFTDDVFGDRPEVVSLFTNHPKTGEIEAFNQALCGLYAAGYGCGEAAAPGQEAAPSAVVVAALPAAPAIDVTPRETGQPPAAVETQARDTREETQTMDDIVKALGRALRQLGEPALREPYDRSTPPLGSVVISGTGLGLPGGAKTVMDPDNALRILRGEGLIDLLPVRFRRRMLDKGITRIVKADDGSGSFETITSPDEVVRLAGRAGAFNLTEEYGVPDKLVEALDITSQLAIAAGLDALREAGIPLVQTYRVTGSGKYLPDRWLLPEALRDETGIIFASAFPGGNRFAEELERYFAWQNRLDQLALLEDLRGHTADEETLQELARRANDLRAALKADPYTFDRRFLFRVLSMGHSQLAEYIGARGPNTQVNAACASTAQAVALAEDWIRAGRCRRVVVVGADDVTSDRLIEWIGAGFVATGAAATDDRVEEAALPFDRRRHGTIIGMGACALVVESEDAVRERGMRGIVELLSSETANSAFHGTRLDIDHISQVMNNLITSAERRFGVARHEIAPRLVFMSHETFTPARGGSASAEVAALRQTFGPAADEIVMANTKGFTGHAMGAGVEDVIAIKALEYGIVPPVPNFKEIDPELGSLNLSRGGRYPVRYALHLAAGFGSQIAMTLTRRIPGGLDRVDGQAQYRRWLADVSGYDRAETEVVKRVLRVKVDGTHPRQPVASAWRYGTGPAVRAAVAGGDATATNGVLVPQPARADTAAAGPARPGNGRGDGHGSGNGHRGTPAAAFATAAVAPPPTAEPPAAMAAARATPVAPPQAAPSVPAAVTRAAEPPAARSPQAAPAVLPPAEPVGTVPAPAPATTACDAVAEQVLAIVAEKTGYPPDMLDLDLDMEADLGIDTVKQAETFLAIREAFAIPRRDDLRLRDYPTLGQVIGFVHAMRPDLAPNAAAAPGDPAPAAALPTLAPPAAPPAPMPAPALSAPAMRPLASLADADRVPRRAPVAVVRPPLSLGKETGVHLAGGSRIVVAGDLGGVGEQLAGCLAARGAEVLALDPRAGSAAVEDQVRAWLAAGPVQGVYWLPALDVEPDLEQLDLPGWQAAVGCRVKVLATAMRILYESVQSAGSFLVTATRLGGLHGYGPDGATAPLGGAVAGFAKAYQRERPQALVKVVDFAAGEDAAVVAEALVGETLADPVAVEVGHRAGVRYGVSLALAPAGAPGAGPALGPETVFVISGAAGGITSAIVADLAAASAGTFYLLDLAPEPERSDPQIAAFRQDKEALKQELIAALKGTGERPTPAKIDRQMLAVERREAALRAIEAVEAAGGTAHYFSLDLRDGPAVAAALGQVAARHGRIDVLLHAGGIEISRPLPAKDAAEFDRVFDIKADGFYNMLAASRGLPIATTVVFSSVAGRFGNAGQTDYSAANDLLCKITSSLRRWRPETRGIAIDWTAWGGIGMATRGSIPKIMAAAGIDLLPPEAGVPTVRRELTTGAAGEIVVAGRLGVLAEEPDATGGLDPERAAAAAASLPLLGTVKAAPLYAPEANDAGWLAVETTLDPTAQPFLFDHRFDGVALLPGVMGLEAFAEAASLLAPGYAVTALADVRFASPFKFYRDQPRTLHMGARLRPAGAGALAGEASLSSVTPPARGKDQAAQVKEHFSAVVRLAGQTLAGPVADFVAPAAAALPITAHDIYRVFFHGPAYRVLERAAVGEGRVTALLAQGLPADTAQGTPGRWLWAPRLIEACFQAAGLWQIVTSGALALPMALDVVSVYRRPEDAGDRRLYAQVSAAAGGEQFDATIVDEAGNMYVALQGYRTVRLPGSVSLGV